MRIIFLIPAFLILTLVGQSSFSQLAKKTEQADNTIKSAENSIATTDNTIKTAKNVIKGFFSTKNSDKNKILIAITGVDYNNASLNSLKSAVEKVKKVKDVGMTYKEGVIVISAVFKEAVSELWQEVKFEDKNSFSISEMSEKILSLNYKIDNTVSMNN